MKNCFSLTIVFLFLVISQIRFDFGRDENSSSPDQSDDRRREREFNFPAPFYEDNDRRGPSFQLPLEPMQPRIREMDSVIAVCNPELLRRISFVFDDNP